MAKVQVHLSLGKGKLKLHVIAMPAENISVTEVLCNIYIYYTDIESFVQVLTYQQRQDFALVLVIRRHRDVPACLSAKGDAAAVRTSDRRSQPKHFLDIRKSIERRKGDGPEKANYLN